MTKKQTQYTDSDLKNLIKEHGFIIHYTEQSSHSKTPTATTFGIQATLNHPDLEIRYPLPKSTCHHLFSEIYYHIKSGHRFADGELIHGIIQKYPLKTVLRTDHTGDQIYRVLIPDPNGKFPGDSGCKPNYEKQDFK